MRNEALAACYCEFRSYHKPYRKLETLSIRLSVDGGGDDMPP
ncbi:MAG: hypothetical protein OXI30_17820 [Chloroflexota bacterium]|nr:hypothetical protein [Chloroflexota bacterium]